ncbi:cell wall-binding protein YocH precursor [Clostridium tepidiprofundi DSM 19306]|uniref:Cell wall-binding protein YocH n=1 Tax=Clostridium tepidiprofundi DSM 19306 TaxID=1121338 RepID=A0A151B2Y3_9CLOT|nr:3D domain-containing protein [Clostridium tepidiprofundi]KYH34150.1 cell wall-binding protein YocH precursor [Clostridium tepidiprofundi DSM 19306]
MEKKANNKFKNFFDIRLISLVVGSIYIVCVVFSLRKTIIINIDNETTTVTTFSQKYGDVFKDKNIRVGNKDKVSVDLQSAIKDGKNIYIKKAVEVNVNVDGKCMKVLSSADDVYDMLCSENIKLGDEDIVTPSKHTKLKQNMSVNIKRVKTMIINEKQEIKFTTDIKNSDEYEKGTSKVIQNGENGEKLISYKVVYEDGKEVSREKLSEKIIKEPVNKIIIKGTMNFIKTSSGRRLAYIKKLRVKSTAYTVDENNDGKPDAPYYGRTFTDTIARRNVNGYSTVAVDPRVIPLGTKLYVEGYGLAIAEDTGSAIKGNKIDVYVNSYYETIKWGIKTVNVYILK